jgi:hypothetical protein
MSPRNPRVRLIGSGESTSIMRTMHQSTLLNASELKHLLPADHLNSIFPNGSGIHFDFAKHRSSVVMRMEKNVIAHLNEEQMQSEREYEISIGDVKLLKIGNSQFRLHVIGSHFP